MPSEGSGDANTLGRRRPRSRWAQRPLGLAPLALGLLALASCGENWERCHAARGSVYFGNQPAEGAQVMLHPVNAAAKTENLRPRGVAGADGSYVLTTYGFDDGAPEGEYKVTVSWPSPALETAGDAETALSGPDRLGGRYADPASSPITVTIQSGQNELPRIDLR